MVQVILNIKIFEHRVNEWIGEARMLERLRQKLAVLRDIQFAN